MASSKKPKYPVETPEESKISLTELANNPESRTPIIVCVDCSYSMLQNGRLYKMMEGLERFRRELENDPIAADSVELCIVSYGGTSARVECDFESPDRLKIPELHADGETPLADAVFTAHTILQRRLERYNEVGVSHYRPWLVLIGDGDESQSMRDLDKAARLLKTESDEKHLSVLCVSVGDADKAEYTSLGKLSPDGQVQYLNDLRFMDFFGWLSRSIQKTSRSLSGEEVKYDPTAEWGEVKTVYKR